MRRFATTVLATTALLIGGLGLQPASAAGYPPCTITGTASGETITGTDGNDVICTGGGNDTVNALGGNDIIIVSGSGIDTINAGSGNDIIDAALGTDSTIDAGSGDDTVYGTPGDDEITSGDGSDKVDGLNGNDKINGGLGDDNLYGSEGADDILGGEGSDSLFGGLGDDQLNGQNGRNILHGGLGTNICRPSPSDDTVLCTVNLLLSDSPYLLFSGRVVDSLGVPVPGVRVRSGPSGLGLTSELGTFSRWLPKGQYDLPCFTKSDYFYPSEGGVSTKTYWSGCFKSADGSRLSLESDLNVDFVFDPPVSVNVHKIKIHVLDPSGQPAANASVYGLGDLAGDVQAVGNFKIGSIDASFYKDQGIFPYPASFSLDQSYQDVFSTIPTPVTSSQTDSNGDIYVYTYAPAVTLTVAVVDVVNNKLLRATRIVSADSENAFINMNDNLVRFSGRVVDSSGVPVPGVRVRSGPSGLGLTSELGTFSRWLPKGQYNLPCFTKSDYFYPSEGGVSTKTYWSGCFKSADGSRLSLESDLNVDFVFDPPVSVNVHKIKIHVLDPSGQPAANASVYGLGDLAGDVQAVGNFKIGSIDASFYKDQGIFPYPASFSLDQSYQDVFSTIPTPVTSSQTDSNGDIYVYTYAPAVTLTVAVVDVVNNKVFRVARTISSDDVNQVVNVDDNLVNISGRVVDPSGAPVPGLRLRMVGVSDQSYGLGLTENGLFSRWLPKGDYYLPCFSKFETFTSPAGVISYKKFSYGCLRGGDGNRLTLNSDLAVDWVFDPSAYVVRKVKVHVLDPSGQPAVNANVYGLSDAATNYPGSGSFKIGGLDTTFVRDGSSNPYPASFSSEESYQDGNYSIPTPSTSTQTDSNGDFYVYTYAAAVNLTVAYIDSKTNSLRRVTKTVFSGSLTPTPLTFSSTEILASSATISWTYPQEFGPIELSGFIVQEFDFTSAIWRDIARVTKDSRATSLRNLAPSSSHLIRLIASSSAGLSFPTEEIRINTPAPLFDAPGDARVESVKTNSAKLVWSASTQASNLKNYVIDYSVDGVTWVAIKKPVSKSTNFALANLNLGTSYFVRVAATDGVGIGDYSYLNFTTLSTVPSSPSTLAFANTSGSTFRLNWSAPATNGGSVITDYVVEINGGGFNWAPVAHSPSNNNSITVSGLNPGVKYSVRVKAINSVGASKVSSTLSVTTLALLPSSPTLTVKSVSATGAVLAWAAPANGGAKISDYKVEYSTDNGKTWLTVFKSASTSTTLTLKTLKTKTSYLFRASAKNSVGYSAPSSNLIVVTP